MSTKKALTSSARPGLCEMSARLVLFSTSRLSTTSVDVPITILGGAGALDHMQQLFRKCGVVGASAGSFFVFKGPYKAVLITYPTMQQKDALFHV